MKIVAPYSSCEVEVIKECGLSSVDSVERAGYVSPDKKIETFLESGQLLQNMRAGGDSYEIEGTETELEPDSSEYIDELTKDAENYDEEVMPQHFDKMDAMEILDSADKKAEIASKKRKGDKTPKSEKDAFTARLDGLEDKIVGAIDKGFNKTKPVES